MSDECAHSYANKIGCPECGELMRKPCACPGCEKPRKSGTLFCSPHQHSDSRLHFIAKTPSPANEQLAYMMQRDGEQMTNNPTIDGVSRELLADLVKIASRNVRSAWSGGICEEARALLDAPVAEPANDLREHCKQCAEVVKTWPEWKRACLGSAPVVERQPVAFVCDGSSNHHGCPDGHGDILSEWLPVGTEVYTEPPEVSALQSTIAQLQARIAELESGMGEPAAELRVEFFENGPMATINWFTPSSFEHGATKVYAAPPAPVAVVLPDRREPTTDRPYLTDADHEWNDCLDATAALNGLKS